MSLSAGRHYLAIPGPSVMPDRVLQAMHRAAPNIYEGAMHEMMAPLVSDLRRVARTAAHCAIYIANGHGMWEAALANVLSPGHRVLVLATGRFGLGWGAVATALGAEVQLLDFGKRTPVDLEQVRAALMADEARAITCVLMSHVDTATSLRNDVAGLRALLDELGHPALLMADCIASLACDRFEMDAWGVDVMVAASQKGLMTPPGLGFVFFNDRADRLRDTARCATPYWDWRPRARPEVFYQYFGGTAPTHHIYGLRAALDMIGEEGLDNVWARHATLARALWAAFDAWSVEGPIELNIADRALRSHAVTAVRIGEGRGAALRQWVSEKAGVTLGIGLGMVPPGDPAEGGFFRVGHMGHINAHMMLGVLSVIQSGLVALDIPHGPGALDAAAAICAEA